MAKEDREKEESKEIGEEEQEHEEKPPMASLNDEQEKKRRREKMKRKLMKDAKKVKNRGVCYLSRIPPKMDPLKLRQLLSPYGEILRIYLAPEDPAAQVRRKRSGGFRGQEFSEGWVEFADKRVAKRTANMLNGEQIGGKKRSQFYYDIWNIKYLSKFKWDDLTEEIAYRNAVREQKLQMEISAAKKERDFYLSKVEQSRALSEIEARMKKKQKVQQGSEMNAEHLGDLQLPKVMREIPQKRPLVDDLEQSKLSKDVLAEVFNTKS